MGRFSTAAAARCWQEENVPVISQYRCRRKKLRKEKGEEEEEGEKKSKAFENKPPARRSSPEARPGHVGVQSGNKGRRGELGKDGRLKSGPMTAPAEMENLIVCVSMCKCVRHVSIIFL